MRKHLTLLSAILLTMSGVCFGQKNIISIEDVYKLKGEKYVFKYQSKEAASGIKALYKRADVYLKGWKNELSGDGYGGPCDVYEEYYINGRVLGDRETNKWKMSWRQCRFVPYNKNACVIAFYVCDQYDEETDLTGNVETSVDVMLYHLDAIQSYEKQLKEMGFKMIKKEKMYNEIVMTYRDKKGRKVVYSRNPVTHEYMFQF